MGHVTPGGLLRSNRKLPRRQREQRQRDAAGDRINTGVSVFTCVNASGIKQVQSEIVASRLPARQPWLPRRKPVESKASRLKRASRRAHARDPIFSLESVRSAGAASSLFASLRPLGRRAEGRAGLTRLPVALLFASSYRKNGMENGMGHPNSGGIVARPGGDPRGQRRRAGVASEQEPGTWITTATRWTRWCWRSCG